MNRYIILLLLVFMISNIHLAKAQDTDIEWDPVLTELWNPEPARVFEDLESRTPTDAISLGLDSWEEGDKWSVEEGVIFVEPGTGGIRSKQAFGDIQLHMEWRVPENVDGENQRRGNSGIFLQGLYEVQILETYENKTYVNGQAGSVYKQYPPLVNASLPAGEWQTYDIIFEAPVFRPDGRLVKPAYMTVLHNGVLVQNHVEVTGPTILRGLPRYEIHSEKQPIFIQGSRHRLSFRNIWVRELNL